MTDPHRYDDDEVRAIFERATTVKPTSAVPELFLPLVRTNLGAQGLDSGVNSRN